MAVINLSVLTLVSNEKTEHSAAFRLRPLFLSYPSVAHARYESAVELYRRDLKHYFTDFYLEFSNEDLLFWMMFQPKFNIEQRRLRVKLGRSVITGSFTVVDFEAGGHTFVYLPGVRNYMCMIPPEAPARNRIEETAEKALRYLFAELKKELGADFDPTLFFAPRREYVTTVNARIEIKDGAFSFESPGFSEQFLQLGGSGDFDGAIELVRTGHDLNYRYPGNLQRAFYRDEWAERLYNRVFSADHIPLALVGSEGVGKHCLMEEITYRYLSNHAETGIEISPKTVWHLNPVRVVTGMSVVGWWQKRLEAIIRHIISPQELTEKPDVLMVDNPVALLRVGRYSGGNLALSDVFKPYLEKRSFPFVLLATPEEWSMVQEQDRSFSSLFQVLRINEAPRLDLLRIVLEKRKTLEREHGTIFQIQAIDQLIHIHRNYLNGKALPGGITRLMEQLAVKYRGQTVDASEVRSEFRLVSGLDEVFLDDSLTLEPEEVEQALGSMLVGQPEALEALCAVVFLVKSKLADKTKPVSSLLFAGPTGVGKTQAAKALCKFLTGNENALLRFDMNEYIDSSAVARLIGDFSSPEGKLTSGVRHNPFGVLLLDEIEKAHPKVLDLLLQVLDDGRLTDGAGRTVDFTNVIVIMTSNLGAREATSGVGYNQSEEDIRTVYIRAVEKAFRPEFVNRIDQIIAFRSLEEEHIYSIARLQLRELLQRDGFVRRSTILNVDQTALRWVAKRGYDARMGGRALKRQIEKDLTELSADQLLATPPDTPIILDVFLENGRLKPRIQAMQMAQPLPAGLLPKIPDEANGRPFLHQLLRETDDLKKKVKAAKKPSDVNRISEDDMAYYELLERLEHHREKVNHLLLSYKGNFAGHRPVASLRLKTSSLYLRNELKASKFFKDQLYEKILLDETREELKDAYRHGTNQFDPLQTLFWDYLLDTALLSLQAAAFVNRKKDHVTLSIRSLVSGYGREEVKYLRDCYEAFCLHADLSMEVLGPSIELHGYGIYDLLRHESGIHLFNSSFDSSIPVLVQVSRAGDTESEAASYDIIRLYDNAKILTDIRTGFSNAHQITPQELKLLLYGGFKAAAADG
ncbi:MAG: AAA family ATPase [Saprospiraceae bacterium]|nr:AAA family ATPase [Saprospiraceae bacterium]